MIERHRERLREGEGRREIMSESSPLKSPYVTSKDL